LVKIGYIIQISFAANFRKGETITGSAETPDRSVKYIPMLCGGEEESRRGLKLLRARSFTQFASGGQNTILRCAQNDSGRAQDDSFPGLFRDPDTQHFQPVGTETADWKTPGLANSN
jgi:hypothetical protein